MWHLPTAHDPPTGKEFIEMAAKEFGVIPKYRVPSRPMLRVALRRSREMTILCLPKVTEHHDRVSSLLQPGKAVFANGQIMCEPGPPHSVGLIVFTCARMSSREPNTLRACGADDGTANRTPSAWMISLARFLAQRQIVFLVWVSFSEQKWVTFAERRRVAGWFNPLVRESYEKLYQNDSSYLFDSTKFAREFGFAGTPYPEGIRTAVDSDRRKT